MPGSPIFGAPAEIAFAVFGCGVGLLVAFFVEILFLQELAIVIAFQGAQLSVVVEEFPAALSIMGGGPTTCGGGLTVVEPTDLDAAAVGIVDGGVFGHAVPVPAHFCTGGYSIFVDGGVGQRAIGMPAQPGPLFLPMKKASRGHYCFIWVGVDEFAGGDLAGAVLVPAFHLNDWSLDVVVEAVPAGVGVFEECDEAGVGRVGWFPIPVVIGCGLLSGYMGGHLDGCAESQDEEEGWDGEFHGSKIQKRRTFIFLLTRSI